MKQLQLKQKGTIYTVPFQFFLKSDESHSGGDGEIRTLVQTWKQYAFYMLIPDLIVGSRQDQDYQPEAYLLKSRNATGEQTFPAPDFSAPPYRNVPERGNRVMSRSCHCGRNKANLLYFG